jgi:hypothetical protein
MGRNKEHHMNTWKQSRKAGSLALIHSLESRRLMSGWTTVNTDASSYGLWDMAADHAGNVYAIGADNSNNANLRQESGGVWSTALTVTDGGATSFNAVATDAAGDVFIGSNAGIWERRAGQSNVAILSGTADAAYNHLATDAAGDVFAVGSQNITTATKRGSTTTNYAIVRKLTPSNGGFPVSTSVIGMSLYLPGIAVVGSGAAAGVYAVGYTNSNDWEVFKSSSGTGSWSVVDQFRYNASYGTNATTVTSDAAGNVLVGGIGTTAVVTGTSRGKPVYSTRSHWIVRKSSTGSTGSWSIADDYLPAFATSASVEKMGTDLAGNVYAVGYAGSHAIIRTNSGGSWSTSDDYTGVAGSSPIYEGGAIDADGNVFVGGDDYWGATPRVLGSCCSSYPFFGIVLGPPNASPACIPGSMSVKPGCGMGIIPADFFPHQNAGFLGISSEKKRKKRA